MRRNLVFVHLGKSLPVYAIKNLKYTKTLFPEHDIYFIGDNYKTLKMAASLGIPGFQCSKMEVLEEKSLNLMNHPMQFRSGFWFKTLSRFFAINEFQSILGTPIFQVETDVWLSRNLPFERFDSLSTDIAFPLQNEQQGSASFLWLKNASASSRLTQVIREQIATNPNCTDMTTLAQIAKRNLMSFSILPTVPPGTSVEDDGIKNRASELFNLFGGCFDALPYGMFYLGSDPRNSRGLSHVFRTISGDIFPETLIRISTKDRGESLQIHLKDRDYDLFCLHNHAKISSLWDRERSTLFFSRTSWMESSLKPRTIIYPKVVVSAGLNALKRRIQNRK